MKMKVLFFIIICIFLLLNMIISTGCENTLAKNNSHNEYLYSVITAENPYQISINDVKYKAIQGRGNSYFILENIDADLTTSKNLIESTDVQTNLNNEMGVLWWNPHGEGDLWTDYLSSTYINEDNIPDIVTNRYAFDGRNGERFWTAAEGIIIGMGDSNNDGIEEIFTRETSNKICCINKIDGKKIWDYQLPIGFIRTVSVGDLLDDETNEVIVAGYSLEGSDISIFCLDGITGNIIWKKPISKVVRSSIIDIDADGENEIITISSFPGECVTCWNGNGEILWEFKPDEDHWSYCREMCIGDLNEDSYKDIVIEYYSRIDVDCGICCISGKDGTILWEWYQEPFNGNVGSFQSMIIADIVAEYPGNEVIVGGVCGLYCLYGGNIPPSSGREIWHHGWMEGTNPGIICSAAVGDLDKDGDLDVLGYADNYGGGAGVTAVDGQLGLKLWEYNDVGTVCRHAIMCSDITGDTIPEVILTSEYNEGLYVLKSNFHLDNNAPDQPTVYGPESGMVREEYQYSSMATDSDSNQLFYLFDWGDDKTTWSERADSGGEVTVSHTWAMENTYNIKVKAKDVYAAESKWSEVFTVNMIDENNPPNKPNIKGPTSGKLGKEYNYTVVTTDPDDDNVYYWIYWDDSTLTAQDGPYASGEEVTYQKKWENKGTYTVNVWATDIYDAQSWVETFEMKISKSVELSKSLFIQWIYILEKFPLLEQIFSYFLNL